MAERKLKQRRAGQSLQKQMVGSFGAFMFGLLLASAYGCTALFLQRYGPWYCLVTTIIIAAFCSFGMGLSVSLRVNVLLMLPMLCSSNGKDLVLFLILSLVVQGPLNNIMKNFDRAAGSVTCGAELAASQTQQLIEKASTPLMSVISEIQQITRNVHSVAGRVQNFIKALTESVRQLARILRNVQFFFISIGEVCNNKLDTPYRKCTQIFDDARNSCTNSLNIFSFLCYVVDAFRPLCDVAKVAKLFCVIPSYVMDQLKTMLAVPTMAAFEKMKQEFEFNISASVDFDVDLNTTRTLQQVSQEIMEEVTMEVSYMQKLFGLLAYVGLFFLLFMYLRAFIYKKKYLEQDDFDNIYITKKFVKMDIRRARDDRSSLLPLSHREAHIYIKPCSLYLTNRERHSVLLNGVSVLKHMVFSGLVVILDLLVFWIFAMVQDLAQGDIVTRAPIKVAVQVNGSGYTSDIFRDLVAAFDVLQKGNITVLSKQCLMEPSAPDYNGYLFIGLLYGLSLFIVIAGRYMQRLRRVVCASYYPRREQERIHFLYKKILSQRASLQKVLRRLVTRRRADGEPSSLLRSMVARFPKWSCLADFFESSEVSCMACGKTANTREDPTMFACNTPKCNGLFCLHCHNGLRQLCPICMAPLIFQEDSEEEIDSSDDEQVELWKAALTAIPREGQGKDMRRLLKRRIREALRRKLVAAEGQGESQKPRQDSDRDTSSDFSDHSTANSSDADMGYQQQAVWDNSDSSDHDPEAFLTACMSGDQKMRAAFRDSSSSDDDSVSSEG